MTDILIRRSRRKHRSFTIIDNQIIDHPSLSWEARMILIYLLSKPDNWRLMLADLINRGNWGRDKVYRVVQELISSGYIKKTDVRDGGKFVKHEYIVFEDPITEHKQKKSKSSAEPLPDFQEMVSDDLDDQLQDIPLPENQEVVDEADENPPLPEKPLPAKPYPAKPTLVNTETTVSTDKSNPHTHIAEIAPELITVDWIPSPEIVKQIAFNAGVSEVDVFNDAIGFAGHFNGQEVFNVGGELLKWVNREKRYRAKNRG